MRTLLFRTLGRATWMLAIAAMAGCAAGPNPRDPLEPFNRKVSEFNEGVDAVVLKPVATVYKKATPAIVRTGVSNFFSNIRDLWSFANSALQFKLQDATESLARFQVNTMFGLGGIIDVASELNIERHKEDFGQTLGRWGVESGPYVVLPFFGSSTVRDTAGLPVDIYGNLWHYKEPVVWRNTGTALHVLDTRASLLDASNLLEDAALDKYQFVRDAFLQRRAGQVEDHGRARPDSDWESESAAPEPPLPATIQPISGSN
jgi:phospholipid-binding lipoprotein MlaA